MFCPMQILVDRGGCADDQRLAELGPGALLEVSNVIGRGCAAPVTEWVGSGRVGCAVPPSTAAKLLARLTVHAWPSCFSRASKLHQFWFFLTGGCSVSMIGGYLLLRTTCAALYRCVTAACAR